MAFFLGLLIGVGFHSPCGQAQTRAFALGFFPGFLQRFARDAPAFDLDAATGVSSLAYRQGGERNQPPQHTHDSLWGLDLSFGTLVANACHCFQRI